MSEAARMGEPASSLPGIGSLQPAPRRARDPIEEAFAWRESVEPLLALARERLAMDVAWVAEFAGGEHVFRAVEGERDFFGIAPGGGIPLAESYCQRMLEGRVASIVPDVEAEAELRELAVTRRAGVGAYIGVPVRCRDGRLYGSLCCAAHRPAPELDPSDLRLLEVFAGAIAEQLERIELEHENRALREEVGVLDALLAALDARDRHAGAHARSVAAQAAAVARRLGLDADGVRAVEQAALLHDLGKADVPDAVLHKRGPLTPAESRRLHEHPAAAARIVAAVPALAHLAPILRAAHERWDGRGYPDGLAGEAIPLASRIVHACDAWHALRADRPYRPALPPAEAERALEAGAGTRFDPAVVRALRAEVDAAAPGADGGVGDRRPPAAPLG